MDTEFSAWKVAKDEKTAFQYFLGKAPRKGQNTAKTKRGLPIKIINVEKHEVSKAFPIGTIPKSESSRDLSDNGDWML